MQKPASTTVKPAPAPAGDDDARRHPSAASIVAYVGLVALVALSAVVRPAVNLFGLPRIVVNADALLLPAVVGAVVVACLVSWRQQTRTVRVLTACVISAGLAGVVSWLTADTRSLVSLALTYASVLLFPLALYVAAVAAGAGRTRTAVLLLRLLVLLQLGFGLVQYVIHDVAVKAPYAADLINGTSSHNLWPAFALPVSLVLAVVDDGPRRFLWPVAVAILAVYSESKAALVVWLPAIALVALIGGVQHLARSRPRRAARTPIVERATTWSLVTALLGVLVAGLWWTPSVQGTWAVFVGHSTSLEQFVVDDVVPSGDTAPATIKEAAALLRTEVADEPTSLLFGLGPGNSVTHAAEVLVRGTQSGTALPPAGPVAQQLLKEEANFKFSDAQSSLLGLWGDLGTVGLVLYVLIAGLAAFALVIGSRASPRRLLAVPVQLMLVLGTLAGGILLNWPEQATVVLPVALAAMVTAHAGRE